MKELSVSVVVPGLSHRGAADPALARLRGAVALLGGLLAKFSQWLRAQALDMSTMGTHMQRDLNLHDTGDGGLQAQKAWQTYERYRDSRSWRNPL